MDIFRYQTILSVVAAIFYTESQNSLANRWRASHAYPHYTNVIKP